MTSRVVVVGNAGVDTNVYVGGPVDLGVETHFTENLDAVGQSGGFVSRGYAQLGYATAFIGHVGEDGAGRMVREAFARDLIDTRALFVDPAGTARSVNLVFPDGARKSFYDGKSHMTLTPDLDVCRSVLTDARLAHFSIPNWARHLLPVARAAGAVIACDLQDVRDVNDPYRREFVEEADFLFFSSADPAPLIDAFLGVRDRVVVAGMGAAGCALGTREGIQYFPPVTMESPVVDTNGAGDALAVGFLSSHVLDGRSLAESIHRGQIAARFTCTLRSNSSALITRQQLDSRGGPGDG